MRATRVLFSLRDGADRFSPEHGIVGDSDQDQKISWQKGGAEYCRPLLKGSAKHVF